MDDRSATFGDELDLGLVQPHRVGQLHIRSQDTERVQPRHMAKSPLLEAHLDLYPRLRAMGVDVAAP